MSVCVCVCVLNTSCYLIPEQTAVGSMSTDCVRSLSDKAEHTLTMHEHLCEYRSLFFTAFLHDNLGQKKPRRKDTPVLNIPPLIPGKTLISHTKMVIMVIKIKLYGMCITTENKNDQN
uniref:Si:ch211-56a11.2 n=1 Tax=Sinocyclocheilus anshuiensis TaxID=1608454 RepID=A0A671NNA8_9TELE